MLAIYDLPALEVSKIRTACAYLFPPEMTKDETFLNNLRFERVRGAFTEQAKRHHPDFFTHETSQMLKRRSEHFIKIRESYDLLTRYIKKEPAPAIVRGESKPTIIAVGGAKGGIGKSIFSVNLGVQLSRMGHRTAVVDLDLGGANLHLYMGETSIPHNINDFLSQRVSTLDDIMVTTKFGPKLIGGDSSQLGTANINFGHKMKLLKAIRTIDADYVILDLGGDTSYNIIDFFLMADHGLVLTTCDPASYLDAYTFIKVSLYRKLNRLFGVESQAGLKKNTMLLRLIEEATFSKNGKGVKTIEQLRDRVLRELPEYQYVINRILKEFQPSLIVNMTDSDSEVMAVVKRIKDVAQRTLSIDVNHLGTLQYKQEIKMSARDLVPAVIKSPHGYFSKMMSQLSGKITNKIESNIQ